MKNEIEFVSTLPLPLSIAEEATIISRIDDPSMKTLLIERNLWTVNQKIKKLNFSKINISDLINIGTIGLIKAVNILTPSDSNINLYDHISQIIEKELTEYIRFHKKLFIG